MNFDLYFFNFPLDIYENKNKVNVLIGFIIQILCQRKLKLSIVDKLVLEVPPSN